MKLNLAFKLICLFSIGLVIFNRECIAQNAPTWGGDSNHILNTDSPFPLFGGKFSNAGIVLPQPYGFSVNLFYAQQELQADNLSLGFNGGEMIDVDGVVNIGDYQEDMQTVNFRLDAWVLPFLNVYGLVGLTNVESEIDLSSNLNLGLDIGSNGSFVGYGAMLASVIGPVYVSAEANAVYTFSEAASKADQVYATSFRIGPSLGFKEHPKRNLILWVGGLHTHLEGRSEGSYELIDLFPRGQEDIARTVTNLDTWYEALSVNDQEMYADQYQTVKGGLENVSAGISDGEVEYAIDKKLDMPWDLLIGAQLQMGPRFLFKAEAQLLGDRNAGLISINYRFGSKLED